MKLPYINLFLLIFSTTFASAQDNLFHNPIDYGIGRSGAVTLNPWSHFSNPSGISDVSDITVGLGYHRLFEVKELDSKTLLCIIPTKLLTTGVAYNYFGFEYFNIQRYNLSVARSIAPWCKMGIRINYNTHRQIDAERNNIMTFDAGLQFKPAERIRIGFYAVNPASTKWKLPDWDEYQTVFLSAGIAYEPVENIFLEAAILKNSKFPAEFSFSLEVPLYERIIIRGAVAAEPLRLGLGTGFKWNLFTLDAAFNYHSALGISTSFGLLASIGSFFD